MRERRCVMVGVTRCAPIGVLTPPPRFTPPIITVTGVPFGPTGTVPVTGEGGRPPPAKDAERADRKSTRLNSSHSQISYAVFCLKKKNGQVQSSARPGECVLGDGSLSPIIL